MGGPNIKRLLLLQIRVTELSLLSICTFWAQASLRVGKKCSLIKMNARYMALYPGLHTDSSPQCTMAKGALHLYLRATASGLTFNIRALEH